jgi:hypothetical protein
MENGKWKIKSECARKDSKELVCLEWKNRTREKTELYGKEREKKQFRKKLKTYSTVRR